MRVGVYHNPPKVMLNDDGHISGIFGDLLTEIASRENWQIEPVNCQWNHCLELLESGAIDLMPDVARTQSRTSLYNFHSVPALMSWSQVYTSEDLSLSTLLGLEGKTVALLRGSSQQEYLQNLVSSFAINVDWLYVNNLDKAFQAVANGDADAAVSSHYFGNRQMQMMPLNASPILFQPTELYFVTPGQRPSAVLKVIDTYLQRWKQNADSVYYQVLKKWTLPKRAPVPVLVWWILGALLISLMMVLIFNQLLRRQVAIKTQDLQKSENTLNTILDSLDTYIYIKDTDRRYQYVNNKISDLVGMKPEALLGQTDERIFDSETCARLEKSDLRVLKDGERIVEEENNSLVEGGSLHHFISVKIPLRDHEDQIYALCGISTDITENKNILDELHTLEFYDSLTGLPNRFELFKRIDKAMRTHVDQPAGKALLLIDIDDFKIINESRSHRDGDELLRQVASRLLSVVDRTETIARISSDEFACLVEIKNDHDVKNYLGDLATELRQLLAEPYQLINSSYTATVCIGIALFSDADGQAERVLRLADLALNEAKHSGRNSQRFFDQSMQEAINRRSVLEVALRSAIEARQLQLFLQPQVNSEADIIGMEALLRWHDKAMGQVAPVDFIPIAEDSGLIVPLGAWVIEEACHLLQQWSDQADKTGWTLAVNISPRQFRHPDFVEYVENCIRQSGIDASKLKFEVTESLLIDNPEQVAARMSRLHLIGIRFSLDDFGTGYASLSYLKLLPIHQLKIDQSFVRDLIDDSNDEAIIKTILALGKSLELDVIAEGVETTAQAKRLSELGCQFFQGYLYGRPRSSLDYSVRQDIS